MDGFVQRSLFFRFQVLPKRFLGYVIGPRLEPFAVLSVAMASEIFAPISYLRMIS